MKENGLGVSIVLSASAKYEVCPSQKRRANFVLHVGYIWLLAEIAGVSTKFCSCVTDDY